MYGVVSSEIGFDEMCKGIRRIWELKPVNSGVNGGTRKKKMERETIGRYEEEEESHETSTQELGNPSLYN